MTIANEITNYANGLSDAYDAVNDMQGLIPQDKNMNNLDTAIRTIPQSTGPTYTAGNGIVIDQNDEISIDDTVVAELSDLPTKTSELQNDGSDNTSTYVEADDNQKLTLQNGTVIPGFDSMTPVKTFTWTIDDTTYRPIYEIPNTGWDYTNMDIVVAYRITVTGTGIKQVCDVIDHWHAPTVYPVSEVLNRTLSTSAATTGFRYLRAINPVASYVNNATYKMGMEINAYDSTSRTVQVEVLLDNSNVTWNETKPAGSIYVSDTYHSANSLQCYSVRGWISRKPQSLTVPTADTAGYIYGSEPYSMSTSVLKSGEALVKNTIGFLADDGKVYRINNSVKNMVCNDSGKIGHIAAAYNANTAIDYRYFRPLAQLSSTVMGTTSYGTLTVGYPVYLRCTMDANGKIHADDYISTTMSAGYTWVPIGFATASNAVAMDARKPMFYTLDANGKLTHINGMEVSGSGGGSTYTAGNHIDITNDVISAIDYVSADSPTAAVSPSSPVTTPMIADGAVTSAKIATGVVPQITMTNVDPGEGTPLADNNFIAVYDTTGSLLDMFYPVGSYYETSNTAFNPNTAWGGTWVEDSAGKVTVAQDTNDTDFDAIGETGGEKTHTLTVGEMPSHSHNAYLNGGNLASAAGRLNFTTNTGQEFAGSIKATGGDGAHNNLQPYVVVKRWHRTA